MASFDTASGPYDQLQSIFAADSTDTGLGGAPADAFTLKQEPIAAPEGVAFKSEFDSFDLDGTLFDMGLGFDASSFDMGIFDAPADGTVPSLSPTSSGASDNTAGSLTASASSASLTSADIGGCGAGAIAVKTEAPPPGARRQPAAAGALGARLAVRRPAAGGHEPRGARREVPREAQAPQIREDDSLREPQGVRRGAATHQGPFRHPRGGAGHEGGRRRHPAAAAAAGRMLLGHSRLLIRGTTAAAAWPAGKSRGRSCGT